MATKTITDFSTKATASDSNLLTLANGSAKLTKNQCVNFDGTNDNVTINGLLTSCASHTAGTIAFWAWIDTDDGNQNELFSFGRDANATNTVFRAEFDLRVGQKRFWAGIAVDGTWKWNFKTDVNSTNAWIGGWHHFAVVQNGTKPVLYVDGSPASTTEYTNTDTTPWFKAIITDATSKVDNSIMGLLSQNSTPGIPYDGKVDKFQIYSSALSSGDISTLYGEDRIGGADTPTNCVCNLHFRGNANDSSSSSNDGTLNSGASVIDDPDTAGIYATTSPEIYLDFDGANGTLDATEGNVLNFAGWTETLTGALPANTTVKNEIAVADTNGYGDGGFSETWRDETDFDTYLAGGTKDGTRYASFKVQINSDGSDTPDIASLAVEYTAVEIPVIGERSMFRGIGRGMYRGVA